MWAVETTAARLVYCDWLRPDRIYREYVPLPDCSARWGNMRLGQARFSQGSVTCTAQITGWDW